MAVLSLRAVSRTFGRGRSAVQALHDVSLDVGHGEVLGILGRNGAGKTTLLKIVSTLLLPTSGTVLVNGVDAIADPKRARHHVSVVLGGDRGFYGRLSAIDNMRFFGAIAGVTGRLLRDRSAELLAQMGLRDAAHRPVETFSRGMKQRLHLAIGLLPAPRLLLLDEPTSGVDSVEAERVRELVKRLAHDGVTVVLTSHNLVDVERLARRVVVLQGGRITHDMGLAGFLRQAQSVGTLTIEGLGGPPADVVGSPDGPVAAVELGQHADGWTLRYTIRQWDQAALEFLARTWPRSGDGHATLRITDVKVEPVRLEHVVRGLMRDV